MPVTYFISGIHGVGKSTLCQMISQKLNIKQYSCSELIKNNSMYIETSKMVANANDNQDVLLNAITKISDKKILLDGHFCLINNAEKVIKLEHTIFEAISPKLIINVTCNEELIMNRLLKRDGKCLSLDKLQELQEAEISSARQFSNSFKIPIYQYTSEDPIEELVNILLRQ